MEFEIGGDHDPILMQGDIEIELPEYFTMLPNSVISQIKERDETIIACGRKDPEGDMDFVVANGKIMSLCTKTIPIPFGKGVPIDYGKAIAFTQANPVRLIDSKSIINCAKMLAHA